MGQLPTFALPVASLLFFLRALNNVKGLYSKCHPCSESQDTTSLEFSVVQM